MHGFYLKPQRDKKHYAQLLHYRQVSFLKHKQKSRVTFSLSGTGTKSFVNDSFACKSIKFSMTGTPSCLLQQQPKNL